MVAAVNVFLLVLLQVAVSNSFSERLSLDFTSIIRINYLKPVSQNDLQ
jgi:hypothetical protein